MQIFYASSLTLTSHSLCTYIKPLWNRGDLPICVLGNCGVCLRNLLSLLSFFLRLFSLGRATHALSSGLNFLTALVPVIDVRFQACLIYGVIHFHIYFYTSLRLCILLCVHLLYVYAINDALGLLMCTYMVTICRREGK
jgi:hypothetical protein